MNNDNYMIGMVWAGIIAIVIVVGIVVFSFDEVNTHSYQKDGVNTIIPIRIGKQFLFIPLEKKHD